MGHWILEAIIVNVKTSKYCAVSADEAMNRGLQMQCLIIRNKNCIGLILIYMF